MSDIQRKAAKGAGWMILAQLLDRGVGFVSTLILARFLAPEDYGIVAMAMSVSALLNLIRAFGLETVLIQHPAPQRVHYDTAWTMNLLASSVVGLALLALMRPMAAFYREPELPLVMALLALCPIIEGLRNIGIVDFRRRLDFEVEFRFLFTSRIVRFLLAVGLAFWLRNHWALVWGILLGRIAEAALSYAMHPYRPRFSLGALDELFHFSKWLLSKNLIQLLTLRSSDFVIGRIAGATALGLFNVANEIASMPSSELAAPINRALFPGFARMASDRAALRRALLDVSAIVFLISLPLGVGLAATSHLVVPILLGEKWITASPVVSALSLFALIDALGSNTGSMFLALGKPQIVTRVATIQLVVLIPCLFAGVAWAGALGAAWAYVASAAIMVPIAYGILLSELALPAACLVNRIWRSLAAVLAMLVAVRVLSATQSTSTETVTRAMQLLGLVGVGGLVYVTSAFGLWLLQGRPDGAESHVATFVSDRVDVLTRRLRGA